MKQFSTLIMSSLFIFLNSFVASGASASDAHIELSGPAKKFILNEERFSCSQAARGTTNEPAEVHGASLDAGRLTVDWPSQNEILFVHRVRVTFPDIRVNGQ